MKKSLMLLALMAVLFSCKEKNEDSEGMTTGEVEMENTEIRTSEGTVDTIDRENGNADSVNGVESDDETVAPGTTSGKMEQVP